MKEKRSLFETIFGKKKTEKEWGSFQVLNGYDAFFTSFGKETYDSKVARTAIDRISTHAAKLTPKHIQNDVNHPIKGEINYILQNKPNPIMTTYDFIYKITSQLFTYNNAFVFIAKDSSGMITGFYPILSYEDKLLQDKSGRIYLKFKFYNGRTYTLPYEDLIHLRRFYNDDDFWGSNNRVLETDLETAHTSTEGIKNAIKLTNGLKGILNYTNAMLKPEDIKKNRDNFVKDFLKKPNQPGIAALDTKATFQEINMKPITLDNEQLKMVNTNIYDYFGISEAIIRNDYTPEKWNAFFEGVIEPLSIMYGEAFTDAIFGERAIRDGHRIIFTTHRLQYASIDQKVRLLQTILPYGLVTKDTALELLDMHPIGGEEGAKILQSLNNIDSNIANEYQGGNNGKES
ncbi:MAG: phage portal protein [Clostridia bacterium]|nr:phage portal protein [Clostridia bacterium]